MTVTTEAPAGVDFDTVVGRWVKRQSREVGEDVLDEGQVHELAETLRQHVGDISAHTSGDDDAARKRDELATLVEQLRVDLDDKRTELGVTQETVESLRGDVKRLQEQLTTMTAERNAALDDTVRLADELAAAQQDRHEHWYPLDGPGLLPKPCGCGKEYPQAGTGPHPATPAAAKPDTWTETFAKIREHWEGGKR